MTDRDRVLARLREAGSRGVHSHDLRREGYTGNPSQRCNELADEGHTIRRVREARNGRPGVRFILDAGVPLTPERSVKPVPSERESQHSSHPAEATSSGHLLPAPETRSARVSTPSAYDPWSEAA